MAFIELAKGMPDWDIKYNADFRGVYAELVNLSRIGHEHSAGDITSGTLPVSRGGTGASDLASLTVGNAAKLGGKPSTDFALLNEMNAQLSKNTKRIKKGC